MGSDPSSGIRLPSLEKLASAYGLSYRKLRTNDEAERLLPGILATAKPELIEVMTDPLEKLGPKAASKQSPDGTMHSAPLEDLAPFLPREEFLENMLIDPVPEEK